MRGILLSPSADPGRRVASLESLSRVGLPERYAYLRDWRGGLLLRCPAIALPRLSRPGHGPLLTCGASVPVGDPIHAVSAIASVAAGSADAGPRRDRVRQRRRLGGDRAQLGHRHGVAQ